MDRIAKLEKQVRFLCEQIKCLKSSLELDSNPFALESTSVFAYKYIQEEYSTEWIIPYKEIKSNLVFINNVIGLSSNGGKTTGSIIPNTEYDIKNSNDVEFIISFKIPTRGIALLMAF